MIYGASARVARGAVDAARTMNAIAKRETVWSKSVFCVRRVRLSVVNHGLGIGTRNGPAAELGQAGGSVPWSGSRSPPPNAVAQHGRTDGRGRMLSARESEINKPAASLSAHTHTLTGGRAGGRRRGRPRLNDILAL